MLSARRAAVLTAAYYAIVFASLGAHLPYWPVWLEAWGLDRADIGLFLGAATVVRIVGSTVGPAVADRHAVRRWMIVGTAGATAAMCLLHLAIDGRGELLVASLVLSLVMAPSIPLGEALGLRAAREHGFAYAPVRAAGSVGFLVANIAVGAALDRADPDLVIYVVATGFTGVAVLGAVHPGGGGRAEADRARYGEAIRLLAVPAFAVFAVSIAFVQSSHVVYYVYSVLAWQDQGLSGSLIGWLWAFGVIAETALMLGPGRRIIQAIGPARAIAIGAVAGIVRWGAMVAAPGLAWLWPLQGLHALTFALAHLGAMAFMAEAVPARLAASAQGLIAGVAMGVASALAMALAALIVREAGVAHAYGFAAGLSALGGLAALVLHRIWAGEVLARQSV